MDLNPFKMSMFMLQEFKWNISIVKECQNINRNLNKTNQLLKAILKKLYLKSPVTYLLVSQN